MNAAEKANSLELATKIATVVNVFKTQFPDAKSDLKPWANDPDTRELIDPESIDIGFHFPGRSRLMQCRSLLVQIRFHKDLATKERRAIGAEMAGFDHQGQQWRMSTVENWTIEGNGPNPDMGDKLKTFLRHVMDVFSET